jgi:hypothetical protein
MTTKKLLLLAFVAYLGLCVYLKMSGAEERMSPKMKEVKSLIMQGI